MKGQGVLESLADKSASTQLLVSEKAACVRSMEASPVTLRDKMTTVVLCAEACSVTTIHVNSSVLSALRFPNDFQHKSASPVFLLQLPGSTLN